MHLFRKFIYTATAALLLLTACDTTNDSVVTTSSEAIVTAAQLGTLKRTVHYTLDDGTDSLLNVTVQGSLYPLTIDHLAARIFNQDSLPYGTDNTRVVLSSFSTTTSYSIKSLHTGQDTIFTYTDSTDFSRPRQITVYATDGTSRRVYTMEVRVHQEEGDTMQWKRLGKDVAEVRRQNLASLWADAGALYLFTTEDGVPLLRTADVANTADWHTSAMQGDADGLRTQNIVRHGDAFYGLNASGHVVRSTDGYTWDAVSLSPLTAPQGAEAPSLADAGTNGLIALTAEGLCLSTDDGATFQPETLDDDAALLPTSLYGSTVTPLYSDATFEQILIAGTSGTESRVWRKDLDLTGREDLPWMFLPTTEEVAYPCPAFASAALFSYDRASLLVGITDTLTVAPIYLSRDNGRSWLVEQIPQPATSAGVTSVCAAVDQQTQCIYLLFGGSGEIWRGRINRLGWNDDPVRYE